MSNSFQTIAEATISNAQKAQSLMAYCDYISELISKEIKNLDTDYMRLLSSVSRPFLDLSEGGSFQSTKKTIKVEDRFGKRYTITVEEE